MIDFNRPHLTGKETHYIYQAVAEGKLSGNGAFTKKCQNYFEERYGFKKCLLTTSCTDALEMAAILCDIQLGDEVIVPSYTFVSSALAFVRAGAKIVFADSMKENPNIDAEKLESLITPRTKVIVPVHYAGVACDMDRIMEIANKYNLIVVEDAAQAVDSFYKSRPLGGCGHLGAFSFHETKNIMSGEGGAFVTNNPEYAERAEIIREKGTNRSKFFRGQVDKYTWVDVGSSYLPSDVIAAYLYSMLNISDDIQEKRINVWNKYYNEFEESENRGIIRRPFIPQDCTNNGHMFYVVCRNLEERSGLIEYLKEHDVTAPFHYLSLHKSEFYTNHSSNIPELPVCDMYADCLVRMPMYYELDLDQVDMIVSLIEEYYKDM